MASPLGDEGGGLPTVLDQPVRAWRRWRIFGGDLVSENGAWWPYRQPIEADCVTTAAKKKHDQIPASGCSCGIHAARSLHALAEAGYGLGFPTGATKYAWGSVKLWGKLVAHQRGFRAQYAYPELVILADETAACLIERNYGAEVMLTPPALPEGASPPPPAGASVDRLRQMLARYIPQGLALGVPMIRINLALPNGQVFQYQGAADSAALASWFVGMLEVMFANGLDPGMAYHRLDVQAWWA